MSDHHKIIGLHMVLPLNYWEIFAKKSFSQQFRRVARLPNYSHEEIQVGINGFSGTIWVKISKFLTTKKTLNTTKITIPQKIQFFNILNFYKKSLKLPPHKKYYFLTYHKIFNVTKIAPNPNFPIYIHTFLL